jgi:hypothetical protein
MAGVRPAGQHGFMNTYAPATDHLVTGSLGRPGTRPAVGDGPGRVTVSPHRGILSPASWGELVYAVVDLVPAVAFFAAIIALLTAGTGLLVIYVGIPVLMAALVVARLGGALQVGLARSLLGTPVLPPGSFHRRSPGPAGLIGAVLRDGAAWRAVLYFLIKIWLAPATFAVAVALYSYGLGTVTYPLWRPFLPAQQAADGTWHSGAQLWNGAFIDSWPGMTTLAVTGLLVLLTAPYIVRGFVTADRLLIGSLLGRR